MAEKITLGPEEVAQIREAQELAKLLASELQRAKLAGIDVADLEEVYKSLQAQLTGITRVYLPGRR